MIKVTAIVLFAVIVVLAIFSPAYAARSCTLTVPDINFGNVNVLPGSAVDIAGSMSFSCTGFTNNQLSRFCISIGSGSVFTGSQRQLGGPGGAKLNYDLYTDSARAQLWGSWQTGFDTAGLQFDFSSDGSGNLSTSVPIYARLFSNQQTATTGSYSSSILSGTTGAYVRISNAGGAQCDTGPSNSTTSFSVLTTVVSTCSISATNVNFGTVGLVNSNIDATAAVSAQCSLSLPYTLSFNGGNAGASDPTKRKMAKGGENITYGLYTDSARSQPWGSIIGTNTVAGTGTGVSQNYTVYGRAPPQNTGSPGSYSDTIVVTVTY